MLTALRGLTVTHTMLQGMIVVGVVVLAAMKDIDGNTAVGVLVALAGIGGGQVQAAMAHAQAGQQGDAVAAAVAAERTE